MVGDSWPIPPPGRDVKGAKRTANSADSAIEGNLGRRVQTPSKAPGFQESGCTVDVSSILSHQCLKALVFRAGVNFLFSFSLWTFSRSGFSKAMKKLLRWQHSPPLSLTPHLQFLLPECIFLGSAVDLCFFQDSRCAFFCHREIDLLWLVRAKLSFPELLYQTPPQLQPLWVPVQWH